MSRKPPIEEAPMRTTAPGALLAVMKPMSLTCHACLAFIAMLCLSAPAHANASFRLPEFDVGGGGGSIGGGGGSIGGVLEVQLPPLAPPAPNVPPAPEIFDTTTFRWTASPGLFFFLDSAGGNTVTARAEGAGGAVTIFRLDGGLFEFGSVDYAYSPLDTFIGDGPLLVQGLLDGRVIASADFFQPVSNRSIFSPFGPGDLKGISIDKLVFGLATRSIVFDDDLRAGRFSSSIRNVVLAETGGLVAAPAPAPIPEPATWALMIGGFGMVGYALRRRAVAVV